MADQQQIMDELQSVHKELSALRGLVEQMVSPAVSLSISEKARIVREAHASGDPKRIRRATKIINGEI